MIPSSSDFLRAMVTFSNFYVYHKTKYNSISLVSVMEVAHICNTLSHMSHSNLRAKKVTLAGYIIQRALPCVLKRLHTSVQLSLLVKRTKNKDCEFEEKTKKMSMSALSSASS